MIIHSSFQKGMTLIELMVTIAILAVVASIAIPAYTGYITTAKKTECFNEMSTIKLAEEEFYLENNSYYAGKRENGTNTLQSASGGYYNGTYAATDNCKYEVAACGTGTIATCYTLTATGINELAATPAWVSSFTKD